jgi:hypothetical protein
MGTNAVVDRVRLAGEAVGPKVREVREVVGPKAREIGDVLGPKVKELGETVAPKVKTARRKVGFWIAGEEPRKARRWPAFAGLGIGAAAAFFLDPVSGKRRRAATKEWVAGKFRAVAHRTSGLGSAGGTQAGQSGPPENGTTESWLTLEGTPAPTR